MVMSCHKRRLNAFDVCGRDFIFWEAMSEQVEEGGQLEPVAPEVAGDEGLVRTASEEITGQARAHVREAFSAAYAEVKSLNEEVRAPLLSFLAFSRLFFCPD